MKGLFKHINEDLSTKVIDKNRFPNPDQQNNPDFFRKGKKDGDFHDDKIETKVEKIPAKSLKASQDAVYLGKTLSMAVAGVKGGDLGSIISSDNRILDGHHRWAATMFNDPSAKVFGSKADLKIGDLVPVLRSAGDAMGNERGGAPSGDVNMFVATIDDIKNCIFNGENMDARFYNKEKAIEWFDSIGEIEIIKRLKLIQRNGPPAGAPPRIDMPKIEPDQVKKVAKSLSSGSIDIKKPYFEKVNLNLHDDIDIILESYELNEDVKDKLKSLVAKGTEFGRKVWDAIKRESRETKEVVQLLNRALKGESLDSEEKSFIKYQSIDLLKILPLVVIQGIPLPIPITPFLIVLGKKMGFDILPNSHKKTSMV